MDIEAGVWRECHPAWTAAPLGLCVWGYHEPAPPSALSGSPQEPPTPHCEPAHLCSLGPVQGAGSVAWVLAVDLVAVHADDHLSTPADRRQVQ